MNGDNPNLERFDERLAAVYGRTENKEQQYDEWAQTYDSDLVDDLGYVAFSEAGDIFMEVVTDRSARILDVACGTGLAGAYLQRHGYLHVDGADLSTKMMEVASQRGLYHSTWQHDFTRPASWRNSMMRYCVSVCSRMQRQRSRTCTMWCVALVRELLA